jgi:hypothetical protein
VSSRRGEVAELIVVQLETQCELFKVVDALGTIGGLAHPLHGRQEESDQDADHRNDDEQFEQREAAPASI